MTWSGKCKIKLSGKTLSLVVFSYVNFINYGLYHLQREKKAL